MSTEVKIDSRICVKRSDVGFSVDRQDVAIPDCIEVLGRILMYMRCGAYGVIGTWNQVMDSFEVHEDEPIDNPKVCIAFNFETKKIQAAVIGMTVWEACVLLDLAKSYFSALQLGLITE